MSQRTIKNNIELPYPLSLNALSLRLENTRQHAHETRCCFIESKSPSPANRNPNWCIAGPQFLQLSAARTIRFTGALTRPIALALQQPAESSHYSLPPPLSI